MPLLYFPCSSMRNSSESSKSWYIPLVARVPARLGSPSCPPATTPSTTRHTAEPLTTQPSRSLPLKRGVHPAPDDSGAVAQEHRNNPRTKGAILMGSSSTYTHQIE